MGSKTGDGYENSGDAEFDAEALFMDMTRPPRPEAGVAQTSTPSSINPSESKPPPIHTTGMGTTYHTTHSAQSKAISSGTPLANHNLRQATWSIDRGSGEQATSGMIAETPRIRERRATAQHAPTVILRERRAGRQGRRASDHSESQRFRDVWMTLRAIDCRALSKTPQGGIHWYDVLDLLMTHFPQTSWEALTDVHYADGSMEVGCKVTVNGVSRSSTLQVETASGRLLVKPNAQQVSEARMRCWVRCVALFGLGLDIQKQTPH